MLIQSITAVTSFSSLVSGMGVGGGDGILRIFNQNILYSYFLFLIRRYATQYIIFILFL